MLGISSVSGMVLEQQKAYIESTILFHLAYQNGFALVFNVMMVSLSKHTHATMNPIH